MNKSQYKIAFPSLPITVDEHFQLHFQEAFTCSSRGSKDASMMRDLLYQPDRVPKNEHCYDIYRDIAYEEHRALFAQYDFRYDITVIMPGMLGREYKKTSGHYHGRIPGSPYPYPEIYEVLCGKALYILQKSDIFDNQNGNKIEELKAVVAEEGQAVIIPPFYGHCSINIGSSPLVFSNIAVTSCPLFYEPVARKHGLSLYAVKDEKEGFRLLPNPEYSSLPGITLVRASKNPGMGITFTDSVYHNFTDSPETFRYLLEPGSFLEEMECMLQTKI